MDGGGVGRAEEVVPGGVLGEEEEVARGYVDEGVED